MANVARDVIWPTDDNIIVRAVFLYVGQGDCTIVLVKDGDTYKTVVVDTNLDETNGGIEIPALVKDLVEDEDGKLGVFVNTHPHNDHLSGVVELSDEVDIQEVWHSGHKPGKKHEDSYKNLKKVIKKVKKKHGDESETELLGSRSATDFGEGQYYVLAPAKHVTDDINDETADTRYRRIHEQCAVLKFGNGDAWIMLPGDADRDAFEKHITDYHKDRLPADVLGASHHGSRTFFRYDKKDDPYLTALETIAPTYVILSAPTTKESPFDHPHKDAVKYYEDEVGKDNVVHTGKNRECFIADVFANGTVELSTDTELVDAYQLGKKKDDGGDDGKSSKKLAPARAKASAAPAVITGTKIDNRPMGLN